jgi:hypothetical protein
VTLLEDYLPRAALAEQLDVCERTLARYEAEPDGLPVTVIGGRRLYRVDAVREWLTARERQRNPRRRGNHTSREVRAA